MGALITLIFMKSYIFYLLIFFSLFFYNCKEKNESEPHLVYEGIYSIKLPNNTALASILKIMINKDKSTEYFSLFDGPYRTIYIYSFKNKNLIKTITIKDSIYDSYEGSYYVHNLDSIFLLELFSNNIYLIDGNGNTIKKIPLRDKKFLESENKNNNKYIPFACDASNSNGFFYYNGKVYLSSTGNASVDFSENCRDIFEVDIKNNKSSLVFKKPELFYTGYWGYNLQHSLQLIFNPINNMFIVSYGADHFVYETNFESINKKASVDSKYLKNIKPFGLNQPSTYSKNTSIDNYDLTNGSYSRMYFDEKNKIYLRFVNIPLSKEKLEEGQKTGINNAQRSVIITDTKFNKITEFMLNDSLSIPVFIHDGKLFFNDNNMYRENSDSLYFKIYSIKL